MSTDRLHNLLISEQYSPQSPTIESLAKSNQYLTSLIQFVTSTLEMKTIEDIVWFLTDSVIGQLGFEDCIVYLLEPDTNLLVQRAAYGDKNPQGKVILDPITLQLGEGVVGRCAQSKQIQLINDVSESDFYIVDDKSRQSELAVPIVFEGKLVGVIDSEHSQKNFYSQYHVSTLMAIASVIASKYSSLENVKKLKTTIQSLEDVKLLQKALFDITELVHISTDLNDFYQKLHRILSHLIMAESFYICLYDETIKKLNFPYYYSDKVGTVFDYDAPNQELEKELATRVIADHQPLFLSHKEIARFQKNNSLNCHAVVPYSWMGAPLAIGNQVTGMVAVQNFNSQAAFSDKSQELLTYAAQQISTAIKRKSDETLLQHLALHDELTGLPNRTLFIDRLSHALESDLRRTERLTCILYLDLDRFKLVNDSYGHHIGDQLLRSVSVKIKSCLRKHDTLARLSGDEFAILLEDVSDLHVVETLSQRIIAELRTPIVTDDCHIVTSTSIGIVHANEFESDTLLATDILRCADNAMYQAKQRGKGCYVFHHKLANDHLRDVLIVEQAISTAIEEKQFVCYLQPIINLKNQAIVGFETLIRWQHPTRGLVSPSEFIEIAEKSGQIIEIDHYMLTCACELLQKWLGDNDSVPYLNINVSSSSIASEGYLSCFQSTLLQYNIPHGYLNIEITERALINNLEQASYILDEIKQAGQKIVLDDFGTGYSSLSYLNKLPIDVVKVDRSFVSTLDKSHASKSIVKAIISLASSLDMQVVIEGIEESAQQDIAISLGADIAQGFLYYKPLSVDKAYALFSGK